MVRDGMGKDGTGQGGMGKDGMGRNGKRWDGTGRNGKGWDGKGWDGTARGKGHDGKQMPSVRVEGGVVCLANGAPPSNLWPSPPLYHTQL
ncbi:hypothetical protein Pmani_025023 [Petrolisthes manimaculis]|uniref:Uncharacterized protein n=1 Tax=Petrolisthes manimaculis TaxID=1843537 RepID=A0AAE1P6D0_9EUCA|nr:hypothetical protein Pmani_025023 [Petrolisthes manimaculis]